MDQSASAKPSGQGKMVFIGLVGFCVFLTIVGSILTWIGHPAQGDALRRGNVYTIWLVVVAVMNLLMVVLGKHHTGFGSCAIYLATVTELTSSTHYWGHQQAISSVNLRVAGGILGLTGAWGSFIAFFHDREIKPPNFDPIRVTPGFLLMFGEILLWAHHKSWGHVVIPLQGTFLAFCWFLGVLWSVPTAGTVAFFGALYLLYQYWVAMVGLAAPQSGQIALCWYVVGILAIIFIHVYEGMAEDQRSPPDWKEPKTIVFLVGLIFVVCGTMMVWMNDANASPNGFATLETFQSVQPGTTSSRLASVRAQHAHAHEYNNRLKYQNETAEFKPVKIRTMQVLATTTPKCTSAHCQDSDGLELTNSNYGSTIGYRNELPDAVPTVGGAAWLSFWVIVTSICIGMFVFGESPIPLTIATALFLAWVTDCFSEAHWAGHRTRGNRHAKVQLAALILELIGTHLAWFAGALKVFKIGGGDATGAPERRPAPQLGIANIIIIGGSVIMVLGNVFMWIAHGKSLSHNVVFVQPFYLGCCSILSNVLGIGSDGSFEFFMACFLLPSYFVATFWAHYWAAVLGMIVIDLGMLISAVGFTIKWVQADTAGDKPAPDHLTEPLNTDQML